jgi:plastocyanin
MRMLRVVALCAVFALALQGTAYAGFIVDISVTDFAFTPSHYTAPGVGPDDVGWKNNSAATPHTATSDGIEADVGATTAGPSLWDTGDIAPTTEIGHMFTIAGTFGYHCTHHPDVMKGQVIVPMQVPTTGMKGSPFNVTWASGTGVPTGFTEIIQMNAPVKSGRTRHWVTKFTATGATLSGQVTPARKGVYKFRARIKNDSTSGVSLYSPVAKVSVS